MTTERELRAATIRDTRQNTLTREQFGYLDLWKRHGEQVTVTLPAEDWNCLLVEQLGQTLTPDIGVPRLNAAILGIIRQTGAAEKDGKPMNVQAQEHAAELRRWATVTRERADREYDQGHQTQSEKAAAYCAASAYETAANYITGNRTAPAIG